MAGFSQGGGRRRALSRMDGRRAGSRAPTSGAWDVAGAMATGHDAYTQRKVREKLLRQLPVFVFRRRRNCGPHGRAGRTTPIYEKLRLNTAVFGG